MPPDRRFVEETLAGLEDTVRFLREQARRSLEEFIASREACYGTAYALVMAIECVAGIASHLIAARNEPPPAAMADSFEALAVCGILRDAELASRLVSMARFRNLLVHRYWQVDYAKVHAVLLEHLDDFGRYALEIRGHLDRNE